MKKNILSIIILGFTFMVNAQDQTINGTTFKQNSRVGIGTTNPSAELEVKSALNDNSEIHINAGTDGGKSIIRFQDAGQGAWAFLSNYPVAGKFSLYNYHNNTNSIIIDQNGRVGIGTVDPQTPIHSVGKGDMRQLRLERTGSSMGFSDLGGANGNFRIWAGGYNNGKKFIIQASNGNVGIGTLSPGSWKLAVNGQIRAKEIKVETGWSDFVFFDDYKLPTLREVENHIKENGHLKDIPSAKEVEKNGIFLGEMDSKLLQKIEELTLYTIQQEKKIKIQSSKLEKQELKISELQSLNKKLLELQLRLEKLESEK